MNDIRRHYSTVAIVANNTAATTSAHIAFAPFAGGAVMIANTGSATQINWYGTPSMDITPLQIFSDGAAVTTAVTVGCAPLPDACFAMPFVVPVVSGGTTCAMTVFLKG